MSTKLKKLAKKEIGIETDWMRGYKMGQSKLARHILDRDVTDIHSVGEVVSLLGRIAKNEEMV